MVEREMTARKKQFGIDLWDLISSNNQKRQNDLIAAPALFKGMEEKIKAPLDECSKDIALLKGSLAEKESEFYKLQVKRESTLGGGIGTWVSNSSAETKLKAQMALLERDIKIRKEKFGVDIWELVSENSSMAETISKETKNKGALGSIGGAIGGFGKGIKGGAASGLGKLSKDERAIQDCVDKAKEDIGYLQRSKDRKQSMIDSLS